MSTNKEKNTRIDWELVKRHAVSAGVQIGIAMISGAAFGLAQGLIPVSRATKLMEVAKVVPLPKIG